MWKSFNICFSKFKCFPTITFSQPPAAAVNTDDEQDQDHQFSATTNPTLFKNFNSLYDANYSDSSTSKSRTFSPSSATAAAATEEDFLSSSSADSDNDCIPDFTSAFASHRFFFSSPGSSNSIFELPEPPPPQGSDAVVGGGVAVQTFSPDPYSDFRQSMLAMIEARDLSDVEADWEFLNELLVCYLTLNPKHTHKFIVGAFADVVVSLVSPPPAGKPHLRRHGATSHFSN
ncbi:hypothetical protein C2S53_016688 [Perilla frutescens var. hirtella]|uniref:Transcription repressor n=1 Tax=Perilla frutescens var. hirtella TaxID=608512 RepID=A0AAD4IU17_PERFH|nr:hypothetical protein C2S53_016688 [Perilla frutescens var. hirtella]